MHAHIAHMAEGRRRERRSRDGYGPDVPSLFVRDQECPQQKACKAGVQGLGTTRTKKGLGERRRRDVALAESRVSPGGRFVCWV
jgi:hypothetical protein